MWATFEGRRQLHTGFGGPRKRPPGRRRRWEDNIKMGSINLTEGRDKRLAFVKTIMTLQIS